MGILGLLASAALADAPATSTAPCPDASADQALLSALLLLSDDQTAADAAARLGLLHDPRAVAPLEHTVESRAPQVAVAAVAALAHYPDAEPALADWIVTLRLPLSVREAAARALGEQGQKAGGDAIVAALQDHGLPTELRATLLDVIHTRFPDRATDVAGVVSRDGTPWLVGGGAVGLGFALASAGHFGKTTSLEPIGAVTGAVAGGTFGYVSGRAWPMEAGQAAFFASSGILGTVGGTVTGAALSTNSSGDGAYVGGLLGEALGFGFGYGLRKQQAGTEMDAWEAMGVSGATGLLVGTGTRFLRGKKDDTYYDPSTGNTIRPEGHPSVEATGIGLLAGGFAGEALAPRIDVHPLDAGLIGMSAVYGTFLGLLTPLPSDVDRRGLPFTGLSAGLLVGYGLSPTVDLGPDVTVGSAGGLGAGALIGLGAEELADRNNHHPSAASTFALIGGTAGMVGGGLLAWENPRPMQWNDGVLTGTVASWTLFQTVGWLQVSDQASADKGLLYLLPSAAGFATAVASPVFDVDVGSPLAASSLGLWGVYLGYTVSELSGGDSADPWLPIMLGSDAGLGVGVLLVSPAVGANPAVVGLADGGGVLGGSLAALGASFVTDKSDPILTSSLVGAGLGAAGGAAIGAALLHKHPAIAELHLPAIHVPGRWRLQPTSMWDADVGKTAYGARLDVTGW